MVCDVLKEIFADEWNKRELEMQKKESQIQQKESQIQQKESQIQQRELLLIEREENIKKKMEKKENRLNLLIQLLLHDNLMDDLKKAIEDRAYLEQMYQRYGL